MKYTNEQYKAFNPLLKDKLCGIFSFIERHKDNEEGHLKNVGFTYEGILLSIRILSINGVQKTDEQFAENFIQSLEDIKELLELQPSVRVFFYHENQVEVNGEIEVVEVGEEKTYNTYDIDELKWRVTRDRRGYKNLRIISMKNLECSFE